MYARLIRSRVVNISLYKNNIINLGKYNKIITINIQTNTFSNFTSNNHNTTNRDNNNNNNNNTNNNNKNDNNNPKLSAELRGLLYRSKQRGWLELDLILGSWANINLHKLNKQQLNEYSHLINNAENPDLVKWIIECIPAPDEYNTKILHSIRLFAQSNQGKNLFIKPGNQS